MEALKRHGRGRKTNEQTAFMFSMGIEALFERDVTIALI